jgi:plasmid maintenance system killer protein
MIRSFKNAATEDIFNGVRINDQYRICFLWTEGGPEEVEIVDYH